MRLTVRAAALSLALLGCVTACSSSSGSTTHTKPVDLSTGSVHGLGTVLVNGQDLTLYMFPPDEHQKVTCVGPCAVVWPPAIVPAGRKPVVDGDVKTSLLGTVPDPGRPGKDVVTYNGWPLYTYSGDTAPGQARGQALDNSGGLWFVMNPAGKIIKHSR